MRATVGALLALVPVLVGTGCANTCSQIGCEDHLQVWVDASGFESGTYEGIFDLDGMPASCSLHFVRGCGGEATPCIDAPDCDRVTLATHGPSPMLHFAFPGTPEHVVYRLRYEGEELTAGTLEPAYERDRPNGPGCPPVCQQAIEEVDP